MRRLPSRVFVTACEAVRRTMLGVSRAFAIGKQGVEGLVDWMVLMLAEFAKTFLFEVLILIASEHQFSFLILVRCPCFYLV
jgi:hypothetical protein